MRLMGHRHTFCSDVFKIYAPENKGTDVQMKAPLSIHELSHLTREFNGGDNGEGRNLYYSKTNIFQ